MDCSGVVQGGIHPDFTGDTYLRILDAAKSAAPGIHVHAFSPLEVRQVAATLGWPLERYLAALRDAGQRAGHAACWGGGLRILDGVVVGGWLGGPRCVHHGPALLPGASLPTAGCQVPLFATWRGCVHPVGWSAHVLASNCSLA